MRPDVLTMHRFYQTAMGAAVSSLIHQTVEPLWSLNTGAPLFGLGFALPYLELAGRRGQPGKEPGPRSFALMPAAQGVCHWPTLQENSTVLVDEYHLPIGDSSVERLLVVHALEHSDKPTHLFREIWRVLAPGGQVIVVAPNRRRTWSALDTTPFGYGQPYSRSQVSALMSDQMLPPEKWDTALMVPPMFWPGTARLMTVMERSLHSLGKNMGGALVISARKQVYGTLLKGNVRAKTAPALTGLRNQSVNRER